MWHRWGRGLAIGSREELHGVGELPAGFLELVPGQPRRCWAPPKGSHGL